jgi:hypothetical protein
MNYLKQFTLKIFIYLLFGKNQIELIHFKPNNVGVFVQGICNNKLETLFSIEYIKEYIERNLATFEGLYNEVLSDVKKQAFGHNFAAKKIYEILLKKSNDEISFEDLLNLAQSKKRYFDDLKYLIEIHLNDLKKNELSNFLKLYIEAFEKNELISLEHNYYSFNINKEKVLDFLDGYLKKFDRAFNVNISLYKDEIEKKYDKNFRISESLLYLVNEKFIKVNNVNLGKSPEDEYQDEELVNKNVLTINLTLNKSVTEIKDILGYWIFYGDLRVNEKGGIAFYKNNRYTFRSTKSKNFQLLCYLVKNHGKEIPVTEVYNIIWPESDKYKEKTKKQAIKDSIQTIKSNLKISLDQRPTISFTFKGNSIMLISNSP